MGRATNGDTWSSCDLPGLSNIHQHLPCSTPHQYSFSHAQNLPEDLIKNTLLTDETIVEFAQGGCHISCQRVASSKEHQTKMVVAERWRGDALLPQDLDGLL